MLRTTLISILSALILAALLAGAAAAAPAPSTAPVPVYLVDLLTKIYRGDDGSALYLRQQGNDVYGFGEHPGKDYAYVLKGKLVGDTIFASWWDVPEGRRDAGGQEEALGPAALVAARQPDRAGRRRRLRAERLHGDPAERDPVAEPAGRRLPGHEAERSHGRSTATTAAGTTSPRSAARSSAWPSVARSPRSGPAG